MEGASWRTADDSCLTWDADAPACVWIFVICVWKSIADLIATAPIAAAASTPIMPALNALLNAEAVFSPALAPAVSTSAAAAPSSIPFDVSAATTDESTRS